MFVFTDFFTFTEEDWSDNSMTGIILGVPFFIIDLSDFILFNSGSLQQSLVISSCWDSSLFDVLPENEQNVHQSVRLVNKETNLINHLVIKLN